MPDRLRGASHEHADRGSFTLAAFGRDWAKENFRSVETKFHNSVLIDGRGQGFLPDRNLARAAGHRTLDRCGVRHQGLLRLVLAQGDPY